MRPNHTLGFRLEFVADILFVFNEILFQIHPMNNINTHLTTDKNSANVQYGNQLNAQVCKYITDEIQAVVVNTPESKAYFDDLCRAWSMK
jgi:hypothetical protein